MTQTTDYSYGASVGLALTIGLAEQRLVDQKEVMKAIKEALDEAYEKGWNDAKGI